MHMQGSPADMQENPVYLDVCDEIHAFFNERLKTLTAAGISASRLCFDPGIGFGKSIEHNLALLRAIDRLAPKDSPLLLGISRKSFIAKISHSIDPSDRDAATIALTAFARGENTMLHRVHAVKENLQALRAIEALLAI
jgi:dihydropteroate synthase